MTRSIRYYVVFSLLFFFLHLCLVSLVTFFHFLIDHDLHIIENWLNSYAWELIIFSKVISFGITLFFYELNSVKEKLNFKKLKEYSYKPSSRSFVFSVFLLVFFIALTLQFSRGIELDKKFTNSFYLSFLGSGAYYFIDFLFLFFTISKNKIEEKRSQIKYSLIGIISFLLVTKLTLPYSTSFELYTFLHYLTLSIFLFNEPKNLGNIFIYSFCVISPLCALFGFDLLWGDIHSLYKYDKELPRIGICGIWIIGSLYYLRGIGHNTNKIAVS